VSDAVPDRRPSQRSTHETLPSKVIRSRFQPDEFFGQQPASSTKLPNPEPLLVNLTRCVIEILSGARDLEQISRWVTDDVYRHRAVALRLEGLDNRWRATAINVL
jgi:hypothetical protein